MSSRPALSLRGFAVAVVTGLAFLASAGAARADTLGTLDLVYGGGNNGQNGGGAFYWSQRDPINTNFAASFRTYCIEVTDPVRSGTFTTNTDLSAAATIGNDPFKIAAINTLYDHYYDSSFANNTQQAAFQAALWRLVYGEGVLGFDTNADYYKQSSFLLAGQMYNGQPYNGNEHALANSRLVLLKSSDGTNPGNQDQIVVVPNPPKPGIVPAPPGVLLAGMGLGCMILGRFRFRRNTPPQA